LLGDNAQGKTNALEAIYLFARGKSFRGASDSELAKFGSACYRAALTFQKKDREESLLCAWSQKEKIRKRNGILLEKQSEMIGSFRAVLFSPDHLQMVKGAPSERRKFLDVAISQCYPAYIGIYSRYMKILEHRNALLKDMQKGRGFDKDSLAVFSEELAAAAAEIFLYRYAYIEKLGKEASAIMYSLSYGKEQMRVGYQSDIGTFFDEEEKRSDFDKQRIIEAYRHIFFAHTDREMMFGSTLFGIHRDELKIFIGENTAREFASQGQQRSAVLALKMAEGAISKEICGENPVYLFDDVLSELDEQRRKYLLSGMKGCQFIVTGCEKSILGDYKENVHFVSVKDGVFEQNS